MAITFLSVLLSLSIFSLFSVVLTDQAPLTISLDLYHRNFFEMKDHKSLQEAQLKRDAARVNYLRSFLSGVAAPLSPFHGQYVVSILIGRPAVTEYLVMDTGSPITWWQCGPCDAKKCYKQSSNPIYNSSSSSTFLEFDCILSSSGCTSPWESCNEEFPHRCDYMISYLSGESTMGFMAHEIITFPMTNTFVPIVFGCGKDQNFNTSTDGGFAGVLGLGGGVDPDDVGQLSLPRQLNSTLFAFCLPSPALKKKSWLYFNTIPPLPTENVKVPIMRNDNLLFYYVQLDYIIVGDYKIDVQLAADWNGHLMVDSGTIISRLPRTVYNLVKESTMKWMASKDLKPLVDPPEYFDLCYESYYLDIGDFPSVELVFNSPSYDKTLKLSGEQIAMKYYRKKRVYCLAFFPSDTAYTLGNTQLHGTALTFDLSSMILTFTQDSCIS